MRLEADKISLLEVDDSGQPQRFVHESQFGNVPPNVSLGRWPDNSGPFQPMVEPTFGGPNSSVRTGDVVITEVNYSPIDPDGAGRQLPDDLEYVELFNQTSAAIDLGGWRLAGNNVDFTFPAGSLLPPGKAGLVVNLDPSFQHGRRCVPILLRPGPGNPVVWRFPRAPPVPGQRRC